MNQFRSLGETMIRRRHAALSAVLLALGLVLLLVAAVPTSADPSGADCEWRIASSGATGTDLAQATAGAASGDRIHVRGTCNDPFGFQFHDDVTLIGPATLTANRCPDDPDVPCFPDGIVVDVAEGANVKLRSLLITDGYSTHQGGGIYNSGNLVLSSSRVVGNWAEDGGGGIYNEGFLKLNWRSRVADNWLLFGDGAGIKNHGTVILNAWSRVEGNFSANRGGGIYSDGRVVLNRAATVTGNSASEGGGLFNDGGSVSFSKRWHGSLCGNTPDDWPGC